MNIPLSCTCFWVLKSHWLRIQSISEILLNFCNYSISWWFFWISLIRITKSVFLLGWNLLTKWIYCSYMMFKESAELKMLEQEFFCLSVVLPQPITSSPLLTNQKYKVSAFYIRTASKRKKMFLEIFAVFLYYFSWISARHENWNLRHKSTLCRNLHSNDMRYHVSTEEQLDIHHQTATFRYYSKYY